MLETATNDTQLRRAYDRAHTERANAIAAGFGRLRSLLTLPLAQKNGASLYSQPQQRDCPA